MGLSPPVTSRLLQTVQKQADFYDGQHLTRLADGDFQEYVAARTACVQCVKIPHVYFGTRPDTFAASVGILDIFLWKVKISSRHITCVSMACYYIACKMLEEDKICPTATQLACLPGHHWTVNDLCRMESHVLKKLGWSIPNVSYIDFLSVFADISNLGRDAMFREEVVVLAERCLMHHSTVLVKPAVLAYALLIHMNDEMETKMSCNFLHQLRFYCKVLDQDVDSCVESLKILSEDTPPSSPTRQVALFPVKLFNRPSEIGSTCLPTILEDSVY